MSGRIGKFTIGMAGAVACAAIVIGGANPRKASAASVYSYTTLGFPTGYTSSTATAINDNGAVVGDATVGYNTVGTAWEYSGGNITALPMPAGTVYSQATGINDSGTVVGYYNTGESSHGSAQSYAFEDSGGGAVTAPAFSGLNGGFPTIPFAINSTGVVVGTGYTSSTGSGSYRAFENTGTGATALATLVGGNDSAQAINSAGYVAGAVNSGTSAREAAIWDPNGTLKPLGFLGADGTFSLSQATAINSAGDVVGTSSTSTSGSHAFLWTQTGGMQDLGAIGDASYATGINDTGTIIGYDTISRGNRVAFVYVNGTMYNLNDLVSLPTGWTLQTVSGINKLGDIVGTVWTGSNHEGVLLTPTGAAFPAAPTPAPIPASGLLAGIGALAIIGGLALRRRRQFAG